jgi:hypothetical protein
VTPRKRLPDPRAAGTVSALGATARQGPAGPAPATPAVVRASRHHGVSEPRSGRPAARAESERDVEARGRAAFGSADAVTVWTGGASRTPGSGVRTARLGGPAVAVAVDNENRVMAGRRIPPGGHTP